MEINIIEFIKGNKNYAEVMAADFIKAALKYFRSGEDKVKLIKYRLVNQRFFVEYGINFALPAEVKRIVQDIATDPTPENKEIDLGVLYHLTKSPVLPLKARGKYQRYASWGAGFKEKDQNAKGKKLRDDARKNDEITNPKSPRDSFSTAYSYYIYNKELIEKNQPVLENLVEQAKNPYSIKQARESYKKRREKEKSEPEVAARSGRGRGVRRAVSTATPDLRYNIRKPKPSGFVGNYQGNLKKFYTNIPRLTGVAGGYKPGKLTDSKYGYRTHYMGVITANEIIKQLRDHIEISVKKESNEKRIANLSQLLESKLLGFNTELLVEQDQNKLKELLEKLTKIQSALREQGGTPRTRPTEDKFVQGQLLKQYNDILSKLVFKDGKIDFDATLKAMEEKPAVAAKGEPAKEVVKRPSETSCFYAIDRTISGVTDMSPTKIWAFVGESWDNWYKEALELLEDEAASRQFYYLSGPQSSYLGVVKSMDKNAALNINLFCVSRYMEKFLLNLEGNGIAAQNLAQSKKEPVQNYSNFVGQDGTFATSRANKLAIVIRLVLAAIPKLRKNQNQNAIVTGDKGLATTQQQAAAQDKAAAIATKPSKAVAVGARGAAKPAAKAPLGTQNNPFKDRSAWLQWQTKTPAKQRKNNVVYFVYPDKDDKPLLQKIEYGANGNIKPTAAAATAKAAPAGAAKAPLGSRNNPFPTYEAYVSYHKKSNNSDLANKIIFVRIEEFNGIYKYEYDSKGELVNAKGKRVQESIKEKREKLLNEAIFKKLVK